MADYIHVGRPSDRTFFIYDHSVVQREEDDPKDAIVYYYPHAISIDARCLICGQLMGMVNLMNTIGGSSPRLFRLKKLKFATKHEANFTLALACKQRIPDDAVRQKLDHLYAVFAFYHGSLQKVLQECGNQREDFLKRMDAIWDCYLPFIRRYGNTVPAMFEPIPRVRLPKTGNLLFLRCSHILQWLRSNPQLLGGCIFYRNSVLCTQLTSELTSHLLLIKPNQSHLPCNMVTVGYSLPYGVRLMSVYLTENEHRLFAKQSKRSSKNDSTTKGTANQKSGDQSGDPNFSQTCANGPDVATDSETDPTAKPLAKHTTDLDLQLSQNRVGNGDVIQSDDRTTDVSIETRNGHREDEDVARTRYDMGELVANIGQNLLVNTAQSQTDDQEGAQSARTSEEQGCAEEEVNMSCNLEKSDGQKDHTTSEMSEGASTGEGVLNAENSQGERVELVAEIHPNDNAVENEIPAGDPSVQCDANISNDHMADQNGVHNAHIDEGSSLPSSNNPTYVTSLENVRRSLDVISESHDVDDSTQNESLNHIGESNHIESSCDVNESQHVNSSDVKSSDIGKSCDVTHSEEQLHHGDSNCSESSHDVNEGHDDESNNLSRDSNELQSDGAKLLHNGNHDNGDDVSGDKTDSNNGIKLGKQHSTESHDDSSESHDTIIAEQDLTVEPIQNDDKSDANLPSKTADKVPSNIISAEIESATTINDQSSAEKSPFTSEEDISKSEQDRSSVRITTQENDARTSLGPAGDQASPRMNLSSDSDINTRSLPSKGRGDEKVKGHDKVIREERLHGRKKSSKKGDGRSRRLTNADAASNQQVNGMVNVSLYVQAHSDMVLLFLADNAFVQDKPALFNVWRSVLTELGELEPILKHCAHHTPAADDSLYNFIHFDHFDRALESSLDNPVTPVESEFCRTADTLHHQFTKDENVTDVVVSFDNPVTPVESEFCRTADTLHHQFTKDENVTDVVVRNYRSAVCAHQNASHQTFVQNKRTPPNSTGIPTLDDMSFFLDSSAQKLLYRDHGINLI